MATQPSGLEISEEAIAARMLSGDLEAFSLLYERYFPRLYDWATRMLGDADLALDVVQETFLKLLEHRPRRPIRHFRAYLYTMTRRQIYDILRQSRRQIPIPIWEPEPPVGPEVEKEPEQSVLQEELRGALKEALQALSEEEMVLLDLHLRHGLTPAELAQMFGHTVGAIYTRLSRARDRLEEALTTWILLRVGRRTCPTLATLLGGPEAPPPPLTPDLLRTIRKHLNRCPTCQKTRRQYGTASEWLGGVGMLSAPPEQIRTVRERLSQRVQSLAISGAVTAGLGWIGALKSIGTAALISSMALGLGVVGLTLWLITSGSAEIEVRNQDCPPLVSPPLLVTLSGALPNLEIPAAIGPGETQTVRLPPATLALARAEQGIQVRGYGLLLVLPIQGLKQAEWDGADLPLEALPLSLQPGSHHRLWVSCLESVPNGFLGAVEGEEISPTASGLTPFILWASGIEPFSPLPLPSPTSPTSACANIRPVRL